MKTYAEKLKEKEYLDTDYMAKMKESFANNNVYDAASTNITRNDKIDTLKMPYKKLNTNDVYAIGRNSPGVKGPAEGEKIPSYLKLNLNAIKSEIPDPVSPPADAAPKTVGNYDINTDFEAEIQSAIAVGDYGKAAELERLRNQKIGVLGLNNPVTDRFNYFDPYQGEVEAQKKAILERDPFSYDYREDDMYKSILSQKEKEADKAYKDGYAQLSRQFDGDIPVNMINKLLTTKSEIIDQADSYIPQLRQMAYDMYQDEGNRMLTNYNMTKQLADEDYNKWQSNRDFLISGNENKYNRENYNKEFDYNKETRDLNLAHDIDMLVKNQEYNTSERVASQEFQKEMQNLVLKYGVKDAITNVAQTLFASERYTWEGALEAAKKLVDLYGV